MTKTADVPWYKVPWYDNIIEAASLSAYYACWSGSTHDDPTGSDGAYERDYRPLERRIAKVLASFDIPPEAFSLFDAWVPNRTREVSVEAKYVTPAVVVALYTLLRNKYAGWRIDLGLMGSIERFDVRGMISLQDHWVLCFGTGRKVVDKVRKLHQ